MAKKTKFRKIKALFSKRIKAEILAEKMNKKRLAEIQKRKRLLGQQYSRNAELINLRNTICRIARIELEELEKQEKKMISDLADIFARNGLNGIKQVERDWVKCKKKYFEQFYEKITFGKSDFETQTPEFKERFKVQCETYMQKRFDLTMSDFNRTFHGLN